MNKHEELKRFGERVRHYRALKEMTLQELADKCGYTSRSTVGKIEKGLVDVSQTKIQLIADALEVDVLDLLGRSDAEKRTFERLSLYKELFERLQKLQPGDQEKAAKMIGGILSTFEDAETPG